jgi:hypothetical protein
MEKPCWIMHQTSKGEILATCKKCPWFLKNNPKLNQNEIY